MENNLLPGLMVGGLFLLRLGIPLAITLGLATWLRRLDRKWQAEAMAKEATRLARREIAARPVMEIFGEDDRPSQPCWVQHNCPAVARKQCPATLNPRLPCWLARYRAGGHLPARCYRCALFVPRRRHLPRATVPS